MSLFALMVGMGNVVIVIICDTLRDLVPFVQFKKREKHPWRSLGKTRIFK